MMGRQHSLRSQDRVVSARIPSLFEWFASGACKKLMYGCRQRRSENEVFGCIERGGERFLCAHIMRDRKGRKGLDAICLVNAGVREAGCQRPNRHCA